ncbi:MAG: AraC family transcriptional regulator [Flavipsychrobacter sp.]
MEPELYPKMNLYRRVVCAKMFIDKHYEQPIQVDNIAQEAYFSKFHFIRLFKKIYGATPRQYLITVRIDNAKRLLEKNENIESVCYKVGFDSVPTFSNLFKKRTGSTPSGYQQKYLLLKTSQKTLPKRYIPGCHIMHLQVEQF